MMAKKGCPYDCVYDGILHTCIVMCIKMWFIHKKIRHCCDYMFTKSNTYITTDSQKSIPQSEKFIEKGETVDKLHFSSVHTLVSSCI